MPVPRDWVIGAFLILGLALLIWVEHAGIRGYFGRGFQQGTCMFWGLRCQ